MVNAKVLIGAAALAALCGCPAATPGGTGLSQGVETASGGSESEGESETGTVEDDSQDAGGTTSGSDGTTGSDEGTDEGTGANFITPPDGGANNECDIWAQDCPDGEKCMPWANDGGNSWNATRCAAVVADPGQPGDPCTVEGSDVTGIDTCAIGSMCWAVDAKTLEGTCAAFCQGSPAAPLCDDPATLCSITNDGVLPLCLAKCSPLLQECPAGQACYPLNGEFGCMPDYGYEMGAYGDPCEYINVCDPGLFCAIAALVPGCPSESCCSEYCEMQDPDATCQGEGGGQECVAWYAEGEAPPGLETVGLCGIPN